ncbi:hypothetical protein [Gimesia aquarii]|uniref:Transglutaminase-like superfamily protein n=1 Tax=Gimesia aquarii TaxID=2527964 RepID=A0A517VR41_9PLAN|nr:hypothetical protein [Gimesia aquarii]QDT95410.1 hypothetical protein V144x_08530 [Gimesia aquarii]
MTLTNLQHHKFRTPSVFLLGVIFIGLLITIPGCEKPAPPPAQNLNSEDNAQNSDSESDDPDCNSYIDNAMSMLEPDRLGISATLESAIELLNQWTSKCGNFDSKPPVITDSQKPFLKKYLSEAQLAKMDLTRFTKLDGKFIRNSQLFKGMINAAIEGKTNDKDRATSAFYYCINNIALITDEKNVVPLSPYEICILGAGSAEQRAWVYINLMRQLRIDAVLFRPAKPAPFKLLVGVLIDEEIYLFDPVLGLPIPATEQPANSILIQNPATLASVYKSPEILKNIYGEDAENRFSAEELKNAQVLIMGQSCEWSARMRRLEDSLSRKQTFVLFRNLDEFEGDPGFIAHIQTIGKGILKEADIKVSEYPDEQMRKSAAATGEIAKRIKAMKLPFRAPVPYDAKARVQNADGLFKVQWGPPSKKLLKTRTTQLMGDQQAAISSYVTTRLEAGFPVDLVVPQETRLMHLMAAQQAAYFLALGQYLQGEDSSASKSFNDYLRLYSRVEPDRTLAAMYLMAISDAKAGKLSSAIYSVSENKPPAAIKPAFQYFKERWKDIREKAPKK